MSKEERNKEIVGRWFTYFWGKEVDLAIVEEPTPALPSATS